MAKDEIFDWYTFLAKKVLKYPIFDAKKVLMTFWADERVSQGSRFHIHALLANSWDCPVTVDVQVKVTAKTLIATKKKADKLILLRQWHPALGPGEIAMASAPGYACFDCKPCSLSFMKAKVSKEGKGKRMFKRKGKSLGGSVNPLGLLFLPFGFIVIGWSHGAQLELAVRKDEMKTEDRVEDMQQQDLLVQPVWSPAKRHRLELSPLVAACAHSDREQFKTETERLCREAYSKWCRKYRQDPGLEIVTGEAATSVPDETEYTEPVLSVPVNENWERQ